MQTTKSTSNIMAGTMVLRKLLIALLISTSTLTFGQGVKLVILHTNDTHSQVEPTDKNMGGYARRMGIIEKIRASEQNVLLLDAGDFSQGSPYFNFFNGRVEIDALNRMKYDAITLGNHEFDNGLDTLAAVLKNNSIPVLSSNYNFQNTPLANKVKPYIIISKGGLRIGIFALGVNPQGLVFENNYKGMVYKEPFACADSISSLLKNRDKCDVIICLSHLGANPKEGGVNDYALARSSKYIDVIIGGHSHTMLTNESERNREGKPLVIAQMGKNGLYLGRIDLTVERKKAKSK